MEFSYKSKGFASLSLYNIRKFLYGSRGFASLSPYNIGNFPTGLGDVKGKEPKQLFPFKQPQIKAHPFFMATERGKKRGGERERRGEGEEGGGKRRGKGRKRRERGEKEGSK